VQFCAYHSVLLIHRRGTRQENTASEIQIQAISAQAKRVLACLGEDSEGRVVPTLGPEQEYFLVDRELYLARPDLIQTGRTLFGNVPPKTSRWRIITSDLSRKEFLIT